MTLKWYEYFFIFALFLFALLIYNIFFDKSSINYNYVTYKDKDTVIIKYRDSIIYYEKQILKYREKYIIDSVNAVYLPDSLLVPNLMSRTCRILRYNNDSI